MPWENGVIPGSEREWWTNAEGVLGELGYDGGRLCLIMCCLLVLLRIMIPTLLSDDDRFHNHCHLPLFLSLAIMLLLLLVFIHAHVIHIRAETLIARRNAICK